MSFTALPHTQIHSLEDAQQNFESIGINRWMTPTLINSWANAGSGFETAAFLLDSCGFVHLKGVISGGVTGSIAFKLPVGFRPGAKTNSPLGQGTGGANGAAQIDTSGNVTLVFATAALAYGLSGITFLAEA